MTPTLDALRTQYLDLLTQAASCGSLAHSYQAAVQDLVAEAAEPVLRQLLCNTKCALGASIRDAGLTDDLIRAIRLDPEPYSLTGYPLTEFQRQAFRLILDANEPSAVEGDNDAGTAGLRGALKDLLHVLPDTALACALSNTQGHTNKMVATHGNPDALAQIQGDLRRTLVETRRTNLRKVIMVGRPAALTVLDKIDRIAKQSPSDADVFDSYCLDGDHRALKTLLRSTLAEFDRRDPKSESAYNACIESVHAIKEAGWVAINPSAARKNPLKLYQRLHGVLPVIDTLRNHPAEAVRQLTERMVAFATSMDGFNQPLCHALAHRQPEGIVEAIKDYHLDAAFTGDVIQALADHACGQPPIPTDNRHEVALAR